ncbi:venom metalloproteinase antarease TserMP_A-like [Haemaphysalis longicornis]
MLTKEALQNSAKKDLLVYPTILYERASESKLVVKLTDSLTLSLEKSSVLAEEILMITNAESRTEYERVNTSVIQERLYHDRHHQSSLLVLEKGGALHVEGVVNSKLRIKPVPESPRSSQGNILHSIYEVAEANKDHMRMATTTTTTTDSPNKHVFVVELHVVSCQVHQGHFQTNGDLISYLAVMVNAVNMRYLDMENPRVRYKLVGVTRSLTKDEQRGLVDFIEKAISGSLDGGLAYTGAVCTKRGIGEGEDIALSYSGVYCMAHELAHSLGSSHDTTPECPWEDGFLMSYVDGGTKKYRLSRCSERQIRLTYQ